jgi:hypothetical protein
MRYDFLSTANQLHPALLLLMAWPRVQRCSPRACDARRTTTSAARAKVAMGIAYVLLGGVLAVMFVPVQLGSRPPLRRDGLGDARSRSASAQRCGFRCLSKESDDDRPQVLRQRLALPLSRSNV